MSSQVFALGGCFPRRMFAPQARAAAQVGISLGSDSHCLPRSQQKKRGSVSQRSDERLTGS